MQAYEVLFHHGPATAMELRSYFPKNHVDSQIRARLGELRDMGVAYEKRERPCSITGMNVIEWEVTERLPKKLKSKSNYIKCSRCNGSGKIRNNISPKNNQLELEDYLKSLNY